MGYAGWMVVEVEIKSRDTAVPITCSPTVGPIWNLPSVHPGREFDRSFECNTGLSPPGVMLN
jgi:hypothetical protein